MKRKPLGINTLAEQLLPIAEQNEQFMRAKEAEAKQARDPQYAGQVHTQAAKWTDVRCDAENRIARQIQRRKFVTVTPAD